MKKSLVFIRDLLFVVTVLPLVATILVSALIAHRFFHPPRMRPKKSLDELGLPGKPVSIPSTDSVILDAWLSEIAGSDTLVVITHELGTCKEKKIHVAQLMRKLAMSTLLFDIRNHGKSSHDSALRHQSRRSTDDIESALRYASALGYRRIILFAASFSTFPALHVLQRTNNVPVDAIIVDSGPVYDVLESFQSVISTLGLFLLPKVFHGGLTQWIISKTYSRCALYLLDVEWPPTVLPATPILFIVGENDRITSVRQVQRIEALYPNTRMWVVPNGDHLQNQRLDGEGYEAQIRSFLDSRDGASFDAEAGALPT